MLNFRRFLVIVGVLIFVGSSFGADLSIEADNYSVGGLFTNPLIPAEGETVTITVRAIVDGKVNGDIKANVAIKMPGGKVIEEMVTLKPDKEGTTATGWIENKETDRFKLDMSKRTATGSIEWKAGGNGQYFVTATVDPENKIAESDEKNNVGTIELPVLIDGRQPHFPWFGSEEHLRWATIWSATNKEKVATWRERGVKALRWRGAKPGKDATPESIAEGLAGEIDAFDGIGVDECGGYATQRTWDFFKKFTGACGIAREKHPDKFFYIWHCGSTYPEQMAQYRNKVDLVVLESYVMYYGPKTLSHENMYNGLDIKMVPAWQADLLGPTGKGTQVITSVDLNAAGFNRGKMEEVVRHLRRKWPEMRGFGCYHGTGSIPNDQFVDRLFHDYFLMPVVTVRPGNLWVNKEDDGSYLVTAAVSNIGGMDSGAVAVNIYADGELLKSTMLAKVPAGNNILENQLRIEAKWTPKSGGHELKVELGPVAGSTILDHKQTTDYYVP